MKRPTEKERFQKWERSLNFKATDRECEWAIKKSKQLDRAGLTKFPSDLAAKHGRGPAASAGQDRQG